MSPRPEDSGAADRRSEIAAELREQARLLNALMETQLDHGGRLGALGTGGVVGRLDSLDRTLAEGFRRVNAHIDQVVALLRARENGERASAGR